MNTRNFLFAAVLAPALLALVVTSSSCRKRKVVKVGPVVPQGIVAPELNSNGMASLPGVVFQSQVASPIQWQPWTRQSLERAKDARRLVFCVIAMPQQPVFLNTLKALSDDPSIVEAINGNYVPILVDGDSAREMGLLTADLCAEIKRSLQLPLFVWMTYEGNPVAWIPASAPDPKGITDLFRQSHSMVSQMWEDDVDYVIQNSAMDNLNRRERIGSRRISNVVSEDPATDVVRSIRQLASLYDVYSRSFDEAGGLFPSSSIELLATAAIHPGLPKEVRRRCLDTTRELVKDLVPSAMFDPLDGGVFLSRRGNSWSFPSFVRDCAGQARVAVALLQAFRATGDERTKERALTLIGFSERNYQTPEGLFSVGLDGNVDVSQWMWSVEDIKKALSEEDAAWWIKATGMRGLGNLPSEIDPRREFFRLNTIAISKSMEQLAADESQSIEEFAPRFEAARKKLLALRESRLEMRLKDDIAHAGASFRMVSAYAAAFGVTGDESYRKKAVTLLAKCRETFSVGPKLRSFGVDTDPSIGEARAFLYALALQSVLDVSAISLDESGLIWAEDLATTAAEMFTGDGFLKECPDDAKLVDLPVTDLMMLFDDSTAGLISMAESRLSELGRPMVKSFSELAIPMPLYSLDRPILHTDLLMGTLYRHYKLVVVTGMNLSPELKLAVERLQMRMVQRRPARPDENVPDGAVKLTLSGGDSLLIETPEALEEAVLPSS